MTYPKEDVAPKPLGEVLDKPACFNLINKAPYTVIGTIETNEYIRSDGVKTRHRTNFKLKKEEETRFCTYGPFYEGRKLRLVIRTLVPVFTCKTRVDRDITIYGRRESDGGTKTWAECYK